MNPAPAGTLVLWCTHARTHARTHGWTDVKHQRGFAVVIHTPQCGCASVHCHDRQVYMRHVVTQAFSMMQALGCALHVPVVDARPERVQSASVG